MKYSKDLIAQALMLNEQVDVVSTTDRERQAVHASIVQLFVIRGETRSSRLHTVYLPKEGTLMQYDLAPFRFHNPQSNVPSYRNRLQYIQVSMDNKARVTDEGTTIVNNSNPYQFDKLMKVKATGQSGREYANPYNSVLVDNFLRAVPVPAVHNDPVLIQRINRASARIRQLHHMMVERLGALDLGSNPKYRQAMEAEYAVYLQTMQNLIASGDVKITQAFAVTDSMLVPAITCDSTMQEDNPFFNAHEDLKHISYMPIMNRFFGNVIVDSSQVQDDINPNIKLGLSALNRDDDSTEAVIDTRAKRQKATILGHVADTFGNKSSIILSRQDTGYINTRDPNAQGLAERFFNTSKTNNNLFVMGKVLPMVSETDAGGSANGLVRMTVVVSDYTANRSQSLVSSLDSSIDTPMFDSEELDAFLQGEVEFVSPTVQEDTNTFDTDQVDDNVFNAEKLLDQVPEEDKSKQKTKDNALVSGPSNSIL